MPKWRRRRRVQKQQRYALREKTKELEEGGGEKEGYYYISFYPSFSHTLCQFKQLSSMSRKSLEDIDFPINDGVVTFTLLPYRVETIT